LIRMLRSKLMKPSLASRMWSKRSKLPDLQG
jgi:hypothetical protein